MELWADVRRLVLTNQLSERAACRQSPRVIRFLGEKSVSKDLMRSDGGFRIAECRYLSEKGVGQ
jgi:hypothetical protein